MIQEGLWFAGATLVFAFLARFVARGNGPPVESRIAYVFGSPVVVVCADCGGDMKHTRNLYRNKELWTEWICPRCVKGEY